MLFDPLRIELPTDARQAKVASILSKVLGTKKERLSRGVWQLAGWNPEITFGDQFIREEDPIFNPHWALSVLKMVKARPADSIFKATAAAITVDPLRLYRLHKKPMQLWEEDGDGDYDYADRRKFLSSHGVVDSPYQLLSMYDFEEDPRSLFVYLVEIRRECQPPHDGWRYHKWGQYYGNQRPQCEYLYDDKHIDAVWTFGVREYRPELRPYLSAQKTTDEVLGLNTINVY